MARFNTQTTRGYASQKTVNLAGGEAFKQDEKTELVSLLNTSFLKDQYYQSAQEQLDRLVDLVSNISDPHFAAQAAVYARDEMNMRSVSHVVAAEVVRRVKGEQWTKRFIDRVVVRPDDITEILSYYISKYGTSGMPNALKKGLATALERMNEYNLAKYQSKGKAVSMVDAVNLCHPKATTALTKLINGTLSPANTWETKLSAAGNAENKEEAKAEAWRELVVSGKIGYFALLRNLRNIVDQAPEIASEAAALLADESRITKSRVLPFRFVTAIDELEKGTTNASARNTLMQAAERALDISMQNVPRFDGKTLVVLDDSGSMGGYYTRRSNRDSPIYKGSLFAAMLLKANPDADFMMFNSTARYVNIKRYDSTSTMQQKIMSNLVGSSTNFRSIFEQAKRGYDRVIILSDMQGWVGYASPLSTFNKWVGSGKRPYVYSFDLTGHGTTQLPADKVFAIAGLSEKVFDFIASSERDPNAMVNEISKIVF